MKILSYNIRGLRTRVKWGIIRDIITKEKVDFACFQETKLDTIDGTFVALFGVILLLIGLSHRRLTEEAVCRVFGRLGHSNWRSDTKGEASFVYVVLGEMMRFLA